MSERPLFDRLAWGYDAFMSFWGLNRYREISALLNLEPGERIADLGCGTGGLCRYLLTSEGDFTLVDQSPRMLSRTPRHPRVRTVLADLPFTGLNPDSYHGVVISDVLHHITQRQGLYREAIRILRPGGRLVISDFLPDHPGNRILAWFECRIFGPLTYQYPEEEAVLLEKCGLKVAGIQHRGGIYQIWGVKAAKGDLQ